MKENRSYIFVSVAFGFFALYYLIENINHAFLLNDFKVYYEASREFIHGGEPYGQAFGLGSGYFKYSPFTLLGFSPFLLVEFETARHIYFFLSAVTGYFVFMLLYSYATLFFQKEISKKNLMLILLLILSAVHLTRELHMGNINLFLLLLALLAIHFLIQGKHIWAAATAAVLFLVKPYFLILLLVFVAARQWKFILWTICVVCLLSFIPMLIIGFEATIDLHKMWFRTMSEHNNGMISEHTFSSIIFSYTGVVLERNFQFVFILATGIIYGLLRLKTIIGKQELSTPEFISDTAVLIALIPNLVITDSQHFLFTLPLLSLIVGILLEKNSLVTVAVFSVLWFFYGANSNDLLGNPLSDLFDQYSSIGMANLGLIIFFFAIKKKWKKKILKISA